MSFNAKSEGWIDFASLKSERVYQAEGAEWKKFQAGYI